MLIVVTPTESEADLLALSTNVTWQAPPPTGVTVKIALGPAALAGVTVAIPPHVFVCEKVPG
jgi:hypothetical protein